MPEDALDPQAKAALDSLLKAARDKGISRNEIEEDMGNLEDFISQAIEAANDAEVSRLSSRNA